MPKISIIIPVYNTQYYLSACFESVLAQSLEDIEIICIDDASTDNSLAILQVYAAKYPQVRIIQHEENKGVSAARNAGIEAAYGEYIVFLDSDDALKPDFCERLYNLAKEHDADIAKGLYAYASHDRLDYALNAKIIEDKNNFYVQFCSALYKTTFIKKHKLGFNARLHASEDLLFAFSAALASKAIVLDDDAHICINVRSGSATAKSITAKDIISHYQAFTLILRQALQSDINIESFNYIMASLFSHMLGLALRNRQAKVRRFIKAKNIYLFELMKKSTLFNQDLFIQNLPLQDKVLYDCLSENSWDAYLKAKDLQQIQQIRNLRSKI